MGIRRSSADSSPLPQASSSSVIPSFDSAISALANRDQQRADYTTLPARGSRRKKFIGPFKFFAALRALVNEQERRRAANAAAFPTTRRAHEGRAPEDL